ncbi:chemotaxis protein CheB [Arenimonas sp.]|uniref:chemotaxis protein CheB n=1 Tax=Arenimonas sp. TaxID=1872635 RepID=UPI0025D080B3|nr:chemotaxis protein CheB [Arenimonas sp.]
MAEAAVRVALLARPGEAREQLRRALAELGAQLVAEGDPSELDPGDVAGQSPNVVLVSLEPAVEDALDRFDELLARPGVEVMYDDAEVTRQLDGWDLARWARHLAAKLVGSDLLPPPPGDADLLPELDLSTMEPGAPPTPAQEMADARLEDYAAESIDLSEWVPTEPRLSDEPDAAPAVADAPATDEPVIELDIDFESLEQALGAGQAAPEEAPPAAAEPADELELDIDLSALPEEGARMVVADEPESTFSEEPLLADLQLTDEPVNFSSFSDDEAAAVESLDDDVAALAAQLEAFEAEDQREAPRDPDFAIAFDEPAAAPAATPAAAAPAAAPSFGSSFGNLELAPIDGMPPDQPVEVAFVPPSRVEQLSRGLSLADANAAPTQKINAGALLVLAGLGGPDAVRQLLAALPPSLPLPVLLYQHLDTGRHDRLVDQLAKASQMPIDLAAPGKLAYPGRVAVLAPGVGASSVEGNLQFIEGGELQGVIAALPAAESGVLVLSGADVALVPAVLAIHAAGGLVMAQDPSACFDSAAAQAVVQEGAGADAPAALAARVVERWH